MATDGDLLKIFVERDYGLQGNGNWFRGVEHDSLVINYESGVFFWNSKNLVGNAKDYLIKVRGYSEQQANDTLRELGREGMAKPVFVKDSESVVLYNRLADALWKSGKSERKYWYDRLLNDDTIDRFKLGYFNGWFTVPFYYDNNLVNIQKRRDEPEKKIRPWYTGVDLVLFNKDIMKVTSSIILTEGIVDAILLNQFGIPAVSKIGGASTWNDDWLKFFDKQKTVYLVFDNDDAGRKGVKRVAKHLGEYKCRAYTFDEYEESFDVIDFFRNGGTIEKFKELVFENSKYAFEC